MLKDGRRVDPQPRFMRIHFQNYCKKIESNYWNALIF